MNLPKKINELNIMIGGKAGEGIDLPGSLISHLCMKAGLYFHTAAEIQNVIKGYNNTFQIRISEKPVNCHDNKYDLVLALDDETTDLYLDNIVPGGGLIYDPETSTVERDDINLYPVPLRKIAKEKVGMELAKNVVGVGALLSLLDHPVNALHELLKKQFAKKGDKIIESNILAVEAGYHYVNEHFDDNFPFFLEDRESPETFMADGSMLACMGAIKAGCKFVSEYPMTPSSGILHFMAKHARDYNISVNHVEDELSAINMAIGAGYAGTRSMTATSGGGFALMTEAISLSGMIEAPVVIFEVQRPGPSTGLPTRTGQGDLRQVLHAGQGDFPKIVLAPGTHEEAFHMGFEAFNLAEIFQCPVIVLMEKYLAMNSVNLPKINTENFEIDRGKLMVESEIDESFKRFEDTPDGIPPRSIPGQKGGAHSASSYEHREDGYFTELIPEVNAIQLRRMRKLDTCLETLPLVMIEGEKEADVTLVCWGSTYVAVVESLTLLQNEGISANLIHIKYLSPFQNGVKEILENAKHPMLVEANSSGQLGGLIREKTGVNIEDKILDFSGRPFTADLIVEKVLKTLN